jgi:hypothetical protein
VGFVNARDDEKDVFIDWSVEWGEHLRIGRVLRLLLVMSRE